MSDLHNSTEPPRRNSTRGCQRSTVYCPYLLPPPVGQLLRRLSMRFTVKCFTRISVRYARNWQRIPSTYVTSRCACAAKSHRLRPTHTGIRAQCTSSLNSSFFTNFLTNFGVLTILVFERWRTQVLTVGNFTGCSCSCSGYCTVGLVNFRPTHCIIGLAYIMITEFAEANNASNTQRVMSSAVNPEIPDRFAIP